jgi:hypothetical protein
LELSENARKTEATAFDALGMVSPAVLYPLRLDPDASVGAADVGRLLDEARIRGCNTKCRRRRQRHRAGSDIKHSGR